MVLSLTWTKFNRIHHYRSKWFLDDGSEMSFMNNAIQQTHDWILTEVVFMLTTFWWEHYLQVKCWMSVPIISCNTNIQVHNLLLSAEIKSNMFVLLFYSTETPQQSLRCYRSWTGQHILESTTPLWNITASKAMCVNMGLLMCFWVTGKQSEHCDICPRNK